jgi:GNAT superfamily N-acetyltransferase
MGESAEGGACFTPLTPFAGPRYAAFTFAAHRPLIESFSTTSDVAGSCASVNGEPAGLAVAKLEPHGTAVILSIYVARAFRRRGIGAGLLRRLEQQLAARGQSMAAICYDSSNEGARPLERLLASCRWPDRGEAVHFFTMDCTILTSPWLARAVLPEDFEIAAWSTVTQPERDALARADHNGGWIPAGLHPFLDEYDLEPINSLVLRHRGAIVGWQLTHPLTPTAIHYANLFVRPDVNRVGRVYASLALLAEAVRRQERALGTRSLGLFEVESHNAAFLRLLDRYLSPLVLEHVEKQRRIKRL